MRAYHRVDPLMDERKGHYSPAELGAYVKVQLLAGRQGNRGRFRSEAALRNMLPAAYVRYVDFLLAEGDIVAQPDGTLYVDGWDEWQEGDLTVGDRMARLRNRKRNAAVTGTVTPSVSVGVTGASPTANANANALPSSTGEGSGEGLARDGLPHLDSAVVSTWEQATGRTFMAAGKYAQDYLDDACRRHSITDVCVALLKARKTFDHIPDAAQLVSAMRPVLDPLPDRKAAGAKQREAEEQAASRRRSEDTLRRTHDLGAHENAPRPNCPSCKGEAA